MGPILPVAHGKKLFLIFFCVPYGEKPLSCHASNYSRGTWQEALLSFLTQVSFTEPHGSTFMGEIPAGLWHRTKSKSSAVAYGEKLLSFSCPWELKYMNVPLPWPSNLWAKKLSFFALWDQTFMAKKPAKTAIFFLFMGTIKSK